MWQTVLLNVAFNIPAITLKILSFGLPVRIQGQLMIQALITQRYISMGALVFGIVYYQWLSLCKDYPHIVTERKTGIQGVPQEQVDKLIEALDNQEADAENQNLVNSKPNVIDYIDTNNQPIISSREKALEQLIEQLTGPKSFLTEEQLAILKSINYKGKPILTEVGEKNILLHQASINSEYPTTIVSNTEDVLKITNKDINESDIFCNFTSELRKLQVSHVDSPSYKSALEKANSFKNELLKQDSINLPIEKMEPTISDNTDLIDRIKFFYQEPASPTGQAVKPFTELTKMFEELSKEDKLSSKLTIYSPSEFKFNSDWWENCTQIMSTYHIPFSISFIFILIPLLYSLYKQIYLLLTYLLPEWKKKYPVFFANHKKLDKFVSDLMKNPEKLHLLRIGLSFSSLYSGVASFFLISYTFKLLAQILKKLT